MDDYLEDFVREGEEHVTELNNALLGLESDPQDEDAMDRIFRTAHTLKGNFGAMGFEDASNLAHAIEDLLDEMRVGDLEVTPDRMDHVFAGVDEIEACLEEIEADGEVSREIDGTIDDLRAVLESAGTDDTQGIRAKRDVVSDGEPSDEIVDNGTGTEQSDPIEAFDVTGLEETSSPIYRVHVELGDSQMPGVDAMFVLEDVEGTYELLDTEPTRDAIEDGDYEDGFDLAIATDAADISETVGTLGRVESVTVTEITDAIVSSVVERGGPINRGSGADEQVLDTVVDDGNTDSAEEKTGSDTAGTGNGHSAGEIQSVRVDVDRLDELHGLVEQLVTTRIKLRRGVDSDDRRTEEEIDELDKISSSLQDTVMDMRLIPMEKIVGKFPRLVRDLAREADKQVEFRTEGDDVELDRTILTEISDPLMHLLRNAVDHGIETPAEREAAGKDPTGHVTLCAKRDRDRVKIEVTDDGRGIDPDALRQKAVEKGIRSKEEVDAMEDDDVPELVFAPGFSTTEEVTDVSGRGVGMDVVRDTVTRLDGQVDIESEPGEGTTVTLTLPVTVAIVQVLFVRSGEEEYGIPIKSVDEIGRMRPVKTVDGEEVLTYGDEVYPLIRLGEALDVPKAARNGSGMVVKIRETERKVAIHCDDIRGQEEVVVKPFEGILAGIPGLSGAAVLGEGDVVTILDVDTL